MAPLAQRPPVNLPEWAFDQVVAGAGERHHGPETSDQERPTRPARGVAGHQHDHRPVPEVEAVGDEPEPPQRAEAEEPADGPSGARGRTQNDQEAAQRRSPRARRPRSTRAGRRPAPSRPPRRPSPRRRGRTTGAGAPRAGAARRPDHRRRSAEQQLPGPGVGAEIGRGSGRASGRPRPSRPPRPPPSATRRRRAAAGGRVPVAPARASGRARPGSPGARAGSTAPRWPATTSAGAGSTERSGRSSRGPEKICCQLAT